MENTMTNAQMKALLESKKLFVFDMDGTIYLGGIPFDFAVRYINRLRFDLARELLRSGYYTIKEVSERCGFNNVNYFCLFIKKETGMSPLHYQKKLISSFSEDKNPQ